MNISRSFLSIFLIFSLVSGQAYAFDWYDLAEETFKNQNTSNNQDYCNISKKQDGMPLDSIKYVRNFSNKESGSVMKALKVGGMVVTGLCGVIAYITVLVYIQIKMTQKIMGTDNDFKVFQPGEMKENWQSVAGNEQAKKTLQDVVEYLKDPSRYAKIGAQVTRGILLTGEPGTGKTLLARAMAGEANCAFIYASGADFQGMFVGSGVARVKALFEKARSQGWPLAKKPCIIFIDEFDAVGGERGLFGNSERDKVVNQLLTELDGFVQNEAPIIVIGATNYPDKLDSAVVRPGRMDRMVYVELPNDQDRENILRLYLKKVKHTPKADKYLSFIAQRTQGFSGAKLAGLIQAAARLAVDWSLDAITPEALEEALELIMLGAPTDTEWIEEERVMTAYHEAGHALACMILDERNSVKRVSIVPRGTSGGVTYTAPIQNFKYFTKEDYLNGIAISLGGRAAEEIQFNAVTTGPSSDLVNAKNIACAMLKHYGMGSEILLTDKQMEAEASKIINEQYQRVKQVLLDYKYALDYFAEQLLEHNTLTEVELNLVNPLKNGKGRAIA